MFVLYLHRKSYLLTKTNKIMALFGKKKKEVANVQLEFDFDAVEKELVELRTEERELKMRSMSLNNKIKQKMESDGVEEINGSLVRIVNVKQTISSYFDLSEFRQKHPKLYAEFCKTRVQKGYIKVTVL